MVIRCESQRPALRVITQRSVSSSSHRKDESKERIVEVRTEDEYTANHNAAGPTEPNETTPLTEPE